MSDVQTPMPHYISHKKVHALKIAMIDVEVSGKRGALITPEDEGLSAFKVSREYMDKHDPQRGGYYVVYADGYESFSPAAAFEGGYTMMAPVDSSAPPRRETEAEVIAIARVCHEVNRAYCEALGDTSQVPWEGAPDWQKESAFAGVDLHIGDPGAGPEASHESWMERKISDGWVYGDVKDAEAKTHHCLVPFAALPAEQQAKDFIFRAVVHALAPVDSVETPIGGDGHDVAATFVADIDPPAGRGAGEMILFEISENAPTRRTRVPLAADGTWSAVAEEIAHDLEGRKVTVFMDTSGISGALFDELRQRFPLCQFVAARNVRGVSVVVAEMGG